MSQANPSTTRATKLSRAQCYWLVGIALALLLIFAGVLLQVVFPNRGEPFASAHEVHPTDHIHEEMDGIPPNIFNEEGADPDIEGSPGAAPL